MSKVRITPPQGAMVQFRAQLRLAQEWELGRLRYGAQGASAAEAFRCIGVNVRGKGPVTRSARDVLDEVASVLGAQPDYVTAKRYVKVAADLFGEDAAAGTIQAIRPMSRDHYEVVGIDLPDERDGPSYARAYALVHGKEIPKVAQVAEALDGASPDGPFGNIFKLYDARLAKRTGDWRGLTDRYFMLGTQSVKDTLFRRLGGDEFETEPWGDPLKEAEACQAATSGPAKQVHGRDALGEAPKAPEPARRLSGPELAKLLGKDIAVVDRWMSDGCPRVDGIDGTPFFDMGLVVDWLEGRAAKREAGSLQRVVIEIDGAKLTTSFSTRGVAEIKAAFAKLQA